MNGSAAHVRPFAAVSHRAARPAFDGWGDYARRIRGNGVCLLGLRGRCVGVPVRQIGTSVPREPDITVYAPERTAGRNGYGGPVAARSAGIMIAFKDNFAIFILFCTSYLFVRSDTTRLTSFSSVLDTG